MENTEKNNYGAVFALVEIWHLTFKKIQIMSYIFLRANEAFGLIGNERGEI